MTIKKIQTLNLHILHFLNGLVLLELLQQTKLMDEIMSDIDSFPTLNRGYNQTFKPNKLGLGVIVPIEGYPDQAFPTMAIQDIGVNHVALNLRLNQRDTMTTLRQIADHLLPDFHA